MEIETLLLIVLVIILLEYTLRLRKSVDRKADEKFQKMKAEYLEALKNRSETKERTSKLDIDETVENQG
jgi:hypothetical protein